jgi:hypothetical protein
MAMVKDISRLHPFGLRIPEELKTRLEVSAIANARSLNGEMIVRLDSSFNRPLQEYSDGDLISELLARYDRGKISIQIFPEEK